VVTFEGELACEGLLEDIINGDSWDSAMRRRIKVLPIMTQRYAQRFAETLLDLYAREGEFTVSLSSDSRETMQVSEELQKLGCEVNLDWAGTLIAVQTPQFLRSTCWPDKP